MTSIQPEGPINPDPSGQLSNEDYSAVIDAFAAAIYEATGELRPPTAERLVRATGDLLEALANRSTRLVTGALTPMLAQLEALNGRFDRRQASNADIATALREIRQELNEIQRELSAHDRRILAFERAVNDDTAKR